MKKLSLLFLIIPFLYSFQIHSSNLNLVQETTLQSINLDHFCQTWYAKQILVNGEEDPDFTVNNDELTFNKDQTVKFVDKTFDEVGEGTWEIVSGDTLKITTQEEKPVFKIVKLTDSTLELEFEIEGDKIRFKHTNVK